MASKEIEIKNVENLSDLTLEELEKRIENEKKRYDDNLSQLKEAKEKILAKKNEELKEKKAERQKEVDDALKRYIELRDEFAHDYGYYIYSSNITKPKHLDFLDYLWN